MKTHSPPPSKNTGVLRYDVGIQMQKQGKDKHV